MAGSNDDQAGRLRALVLSNPAAAVDVALEMSARAVDAAVDDEFTDRHAGAADVFFRAWFEALEPAERLAAAQRISSRYVLDLVHLPGASDWAQAMDCRAWGDAADVIVEAIGYLPGLADSPDTSFDPELAARYADSTAALSAFAAMAKADSRELGG